MKINEPERFFYEPQKTLTQIITIYLNLNSDTFAKFIAYDERSYTPEKFEHVLKTLRNSLSSLKYEGFYGLCSMAKEKYEAKAQDEEDFGDDIPDEFQGLFSA